MLVRQALRAAKVFLDYREVRLRALKETEDPKANLAFQVILYLFSINVLLLIKAHLNNQSYNQYCISLFIIFSEIREKLPFVGSLVLVLEQADFMSSGSWFCPEVFLTLRDLPPISMCLPLDFIYCFEAAMAYDLCSCVLECYCT